MIHQDRYTNSDDVASVGASVEIIEYKDPCAIVPYSTVRVATDGNACKLCIVQWVFLSNHSNVYSGLSELLF